MLNDVILLLTLNVFTPFFSVSIADFEQVILSWVNFILRFSYPAAKVTSHSCLTKFS